VEILSPVIDPSYYFSVTQSLLRNSEAVTPNRGAT